MMLQLQSHELQLSLQDHMWTHHSCVISQAYHSALNIAKKDICFAFQILACRNILRWIQYCLRQTHSLRVVHIQEIYKGQSYASKSSQIRLHVAFGSALRWKQITCVLFNTLQACIWDCMLHERSSSPAKKRLDDHFYEHSFFICDNFQIKTMH